MVTRRRGMQVPDEVRTLLDTHHRRVRRDFERAFSSSEGLTWESDRMEAYVRDLATSVSHYHDTVCRTRPATLPGVPSATG